jgi:hypothetical protein
MYDRGNDVVFRLVLRGGCTTTERCTCHSSRTNHTTAVVVRVVAVVPTQRREMESSYYTQMGRECGFDFLKIGLFLFCCGSASHVCGCCHGWSSWFDRCVEKRNNWRSKFEKKYTTSYARNDRNLVPVPNRWNPGHVTSWFLIFSIRMQPSFLYIDKQAILS